MASRRLGILFLVSVLLAFLTGYFSSAIFPNLPVGSTKDVFEEITENFENFYYYDLDDAHIQDAFVASMQATIDSYAKSNNDPYTRLVATPLNATPSSDETFIGIGIGFLMEDFNLRVSYVYPGGAAEGLIYPNDLIVGVKDGNQLISFDTLGSVTEVMSYLSGELNETKTFVIETPDLDIINVDVTYIEILTPTAYREELGVDDVAYIKITQFSGYVENVTIGTSKVFSDLLNALESEMLTIDSANKTLIIDLRDNPGGALTALHNAVDTKQIPGITQQLLTKNIEKPLFQMIPRSESINSFYGNLSTPKAYHIAVLVNERSASAAEVLAAALNTYGGYPLYGMPTYGKGVYQNTITLRDLNNTRYSLVYTEGEWFYDDGKNVSLDPLDVHIIEQAGIKALSMPVYGGELEFNQVSSFLGAYQEFLNYYFNLSGVSRLRIDGYFDLDTQQSINDYQSENMLVVTGKLDRQTAIHIHEVYMSREQNILYDHQLQTMIDLVRS